MSAVIGGFRSLHFRCEGACAFVNGGVVVFLDRGHGILLESQCLAKSSVNNLFDRAACLTVPVSIIKFLYFD